MYHWFSLLLVKTFSITFPWPHVVKLLFFEKIEIAYSFGSCFFQKYTMYYPNWKQNVQLLLTHNEVQNILLLY